MNKRKIMIMMAGMVLPILAPQASAAAEHHDWEDQHVLSINREPARAAFMPYQAKKGDSQMSLNGILLLLVLILLFVCLFFGLLLLDKLVAKIYNPLFNVLIQWKK